MTKTAIFTISSKNYFAYVKTLMGSIRRFHESIDLYFLLVDELKDEESKDFKNADLDFKLIQAKDLGIPHYLKMSFKYDVMEMNTAVKPFFMQYLLRIGYDNVIYFDPDILVFSELSPVFRLLKEYSIVLTPHITEQIPVDDNYIPGEREFLNVGTYNLGFIAVSKTDDSMSFLDWWSNRCDRECYSEKESGLFVDQKWINLVPGLFKSVAIMRHPGCNMAYWNLHERVLQEGYVNGEHLLVFYHFSGINFKDIDSVSRYQNRYSLGSRPDLRDIFNEYKKLVYANGYSQFISKKYCYDYYEDGTRIGPLARRLYSLVEENYDNPFSTANGSYYRLLKKYHMFENSNPREIKLENIQNKAKIINIMLKIITYVIGIDNYMSLMKYCRHISIVRRQNFLINKKVL